MDSELEHIEAVILGACLIEKDAIRLIGDKVRPEMFYHERHQLVYAALQSMFREGKEIDIITAKDELARRGVLEKAGGAFYVTQLSSYVASSAHIERHALILQEEYVRRKMAATFGKLQASAEDRTIDLDDIVVNAQNLLDDIKKEFGHHNHLRNMEQLMKDTMTMIEYRCANNTEGVTGIPTGLTDLDKLTAGWQNGDLIIGAARPSVGKTAFAMQLALTAAQHGSHTVIYSLEMQGEQLGDRLMLAKSGLDANKLRSGRLTTDELAAAYAVSEGLQKLPIHVDDSTDMSMDKIRVSARLLQSKGRCDFIIIDYLQLCDMRTGEVNRNREQEVSQATRKAKLLAKELNIPIVLLCQLNRLVETTPAHRPELAHLRESGAIEQDADVVFLLYRPAMAHREVEPISGYPTKGLGVVVVAKQRNGQTGDVYFGHDPSLTRIGDYTPPMEWMSKNAK